jgi:hypothetical protein
MSDSTQKIDAGLIALSSLLLRARPAEVGPLQELHDVISNNRRAITAIISARDAADQAKKEKKVEGKDALSREALKGAASALQAVGVSDIMKTRAIALAAEAIGAEPSDIDLNDIKSLDDKDARAVCRAVAFSHLNELPIGASDTDAGGRVSDHFRNQLAGKRGWLDPHDGKSGVRAIPKVPEELLIEIARCVGVSQHNKVDWGGDEPDVEGMKVPLTYGKPTMKKALRAIAMLILVRDENRRYMRHLDEAWLRTMRRKIADAAKKPNPIREAYLKGLKTGE